MKWGHLRFFGAERRSDEGSSETEFGRDREKLGKTQYLGNKNLHGRRSEEERAVFRSL